MPQGQHRFARLALVQPLGDAVDEQADDLELRQVAAGKGLVLRPQPLGDLAHCSAAQQWLAGLVGEQPLNVAGRQSARIHLHRQRLQGFRPTAHDLAQARTKRLAAVGDLRRAALDRTLGALHPPSPIAVAVAGTGRRAAGVAVATQRVPRFSLQRLFNDQPRRQAHQFRTPSAISLRPLISAFRFSRVRSDAGILSIGVLRRRGRF